ncbi:hypothetical protein [Amycolatopsis pigmentata]|uniref:Uncharacterized protein n=1 Tax=Amycolatopsis pigmentata TaxID=450801 RepID=A0ABW5FTL1_9PSEU
MVTTAALAAMFTCGLFTGSASASTVLAQGCTGSVVGNMGDQVAVQGKDVSELVRSAAADEEALLGLNGVSPDELAKEVTAEGAMTVTRVPSVQSAPISGEAVALAVTRALRNANGLGWDQTTRGKTLEAIGEEIAGNCGLTVFAANFSSVAAAPAAPAQPTAVPGTSTEPAPSRDYGNIPATGHNGAAQPGQYPPAPESAAPAGSADVQNAGNASELDRQPPANPLRLPVVLAGIAFAGASVALVRAWVLRKVS